MALPVAGQHGRAKESEEGEAVAEISEQNLGARSPRMEVVFANQEEESTK